MQLCDPGKSGSQLSSCRNIPEESTIYAHEKSFKTSKRVKKIIRPGLEQVYSHIQVRNFMAASVQGLLTFNK